MKKFRELKEEVATPPISVRSLYTKMYAKHGGTASKAKDAQSKAYAEVEKKHGKEMRNSLEAFHKKNMNEEKDEREYDYEGEMVKSDLRSIMANAERITKLLDDDENLPEWCQNKVTLAEDYISTVANYLTAEMNEEVEQIEELSKTTLASYAKKATHDARMKMAAGKDFERVGANTRKPEYKAGAKKWEDQYKSDARRREAGVGKAIDRLAKEEVEQLDEKNKPTNPELWSRAVAMAKSKFDVYPSAYANGWAAKWYKSKGGGWRSVNEENYEVTVMHTTKDGEKGEHTHKVMNANDSRHAKNIALQKHEKMLNNKGVEVRGMATTTSKVVEQKDDLPFTPDKPKKQSVIPGKYGAGYSMARQLARQAMQKQIQKMKKPMKEAEERGTEPFIKTSRKAEIVKKV